MTSVSIRPLESGDKAQWADLWRAYLAFYETERPDGVFESTWSRLMGEGEDPHGFCAVDETGRLIGLVHYIYHRSCWTIAPVCYLQDLYADPSARGQGIGRKLIEAVYSAADDAEAAGIYWMTQHFNKNARKLYDRIGTLTPFIKYNR
ncbi:MAG: GNAT family N-acetyltransferase [Roseibium sp.]